MAQLDDKTLQNLNKRLKEMDEILASDYRKALDLGKAFTQGFSTEQIDAFLRKLGKINRADAAKLNVMFNLVDINGNPITVKEAKRRIRELTESINKGKPVYVIGNSKIGAEGFANELKRYKDALSVLGMSTSQQFDLISRNVKKVNNEVKGLRKGFGDMLPTLQRLASAFGIAFSVRGLAQFGKKLIETRGEFEMQFVAMKQIIGDVDAATKIWNQTMQQALQSPFKAMQLVTYTKQLAAYRIETEKLFDTTKRLADVSAGLGVDMGRLILAYGQVKAANFLRASEIRQFTEAGVNILGELSKYFTEIEGRAVSTAQVMERVTKRMVTFADVEEIFKRMTDEGGQFFEMQEVQADTVKGQIAKLHDAYDQMLNTIGKANQGTLRNFIGALNRIVRNWDKFASVLKTVIGIFVTFKVAQTTAAIQMIRAGKAADAEALGISGLTAKLINLVAVEKSTTEATLTLSTALKQLNSSKGGWIGVAVSAALTAAMAIYDYYQRANRLSKELNEITSETQSRSRRSAYDYEQMAEKIRDVNTSEKERQETLSKLKRMYEDILPSRMLEIEYITKEGNAYADAKESIKAYYEEKRKQESLDKVYEKYGNEVEDAQTGIVKSISDVIEYFGKEKVAASDLNAVLDEMINNGVLEQLNLGDYEKFLEIFSQYLKVQTGLDYDFSKGKGTYDYAWYLKDVNTNLIALQDSYIKLNKGIEEVTGSTVEFAGKQKELLQTNVFGEAEKSLSDSISALSKDGVLKSFNDELESEIANYEDFARLAYETFKETFKEEYETNPTFFDDQFEKELEKRLANLGIELKKNWEKNGEVIKHSIVDNQKTINSEIEKLAGQTGIADKEILRQFQLDTDVELGKWIQNQLSKIDLYKTDLLRIQKGLTSDMTDEHIAMLQTLEPFLPLWEEYLKGLTPTKKTGGSGRKTHENASKLISLIKEMRSEYDKLSKSAYGYAKSQDKVRQSYQDSVREILGEAGVGIDYDFTTNEGMIAALEKVKSFVQGSSKYAKDAWKDVQKYIDQLETEIEINAQVKIREDFVKEIEKSFNDYELTLELDKLNISPDAAKNLFPEFDSQTLGELQDAIQEFYQKQGASFDEEDLKVYKQWSDKIDAEILKSRKEKAKQYSKYLEKEYSERAKVEMQYAKDVAFVTANFQGEQQQNILKGIGDKYQQDISELTWKSFKESAFYVEMMDDLSSVPVDYMKIMLDKIEELLANPETLSPRALKEAINARQKILEAQMDFDQIAVMSESIGEIRSAAQDVGGATWSQTKKRLDEEQKSQAEKLKGLEEEIRCYEELQGQLKGLEEHDKSVEEANRALPEDVVSMLEGTDIDTLISQYSEELDSLSVSEDATTSAEKDENSQIQAKIEYLQRVIPLLEAYRNALDERAAYQNTDAGQNALFARQGGETSTSVGATITETKGEANKVSNRLSTLKKWQKAFTNFNNAFAKFNKNAADMVGRLGSLASAAFDLYDALGGETDAMTEAWKEFGGTIVNVITEALTMIPSLVAGFVTAGTTINAAMGIIGLIAEAIQLVLVLITGLSKLHDAGYEKEIENQQKIIDNLQRAYTRLEKEIEKTWDTASYIRTYNEETQNLYEQIEALNKQIAAEEAKKNVDKDKLQDYKDKIQDAEDELENLKQAQIEVFGGIGEEGYRDAAQGFVDAWKSAFLETGDGLQGLQDHFDEFLNEWFVKQATMRVAGKMLEPLFRDIDNAVEKYGDGGTSVMMSELAKVRERFGIIAPELSDALEELTSLWGLGGEGSLSGLAAGIQGMTEEQANILEAYWNSVRGYTANIDMNVSRIAQILGAGGDNTNPMLAQMTLVAQNTNSINTLLQSVTKSGHSQGGYGIKVFAN